MFTPKRLRHRLLSISVLLAAALFLTTNASAQIKQYTENKSDLVLRSEARVDPATLGMSLEIPLGGAPGRAGTSLPVAVRFSSKQWRMKYTAWWPGFILDQTWATPKYSENAWSGWTTSLEPPRIEYTGKYQKYESDGSSYSDDPDAEHFGIWHVFRIHLYLPDGSSHELRKSDAPTADAIPDFTTGVFYSTDGSRMRFDAASRILYLPDGSRYYFAAEGTFTRYNNEAHNGAWATKYVDRNGNTINYSLTSVTDTLGRAYANPLTANPVVGEQLYYVPGVGGQNLTYKLRWSNLVDVLQTPAPLAYSSDTKCLGPNNYQTLSPYLYSSAYPTELCAGATVFNPVVLGELELPNGRKYQFKYNLFGEIDKIIYPTGGYERFLYASMPALSDLIWPYEESNRGVVERWVSAKGDGTDETHWQYSGGTTVTITSPDGAHTDRLLHASVGGELGFGFNNPLEGMAYDERSYNASSVMLRRSLTEWQVSGPEPGGYSEASRDPRAIKQVQILLDTGGNALAATSTMTYDSDLNVISTNRYDYASVDQATAQSGAIGSIPLGTLMRTEETTYLVNDTAISAAIRQTYRDRQLLALPSSSRVKNAAGSIVAQSELKYDEAAYPLLTYGTVTGWTDPVTTVRGLPTTTRNWLNPSGVWLQSHAQYDQCGSLRNAWDAKGNQSQIEYSSSYAYAYPTLTRTPVPDPTGLRGSATALVSTGFYDFTTGRATSTIDANNVTTTFAYNDVLDRLSQTVLASGSTAQTQTSISYDDINRIITTTSDQTAYNDNLLVSKMLYDGLGRTTEGRQYEGGTNYIAAQTQYDSLGRAYKVSNPFRPWKSETALWITSGFDALGRVISVTTPDSAVVGTAYSGNSVTVTDQIGRKRKSVTDGLGRLIQLYEDPVALNYLTSYTYDVLDNLTNVSQGVQTRTFVYDSLKRLTSATNPESGAVTYGYDNNGNLITKLDARSITTTFAYDALNRPTSKSYNDTPQTPRADYYYDNAPMPSGAPTFVRGSATGRLVAVTYGTSSSQGTYRGYDELGEVVRQYQRTDSVNYLVDATYNKAGAVLTEVYPTVPGAADRRTVSYTPDAAGRLGSLSSLATTYAPAASVSSVGYSSHNALATETYGNSLIHAQVYNNRLQPTAIKLGTVALPTSVANLTYSYGTTNNNGNVQSLTYAGGGLSYTQTFGYDQLNRLTTSQEGTSWSQTNSYDRYGNRSIVGGGLTFNAANNRITTVGYAYDAVGNLSSDNAHAYNFDAENKISKVDAVSAYTYDGEGQRVRKLVNENLRFIYNIGGKEIAEFNGATGTLTKEYVYGASGLVASIEPTAVNANGTRYSTSDTLGSPRVVTNSSAAVISRHDYKPFGEELFNGGRTVGMGYGVVDGVRQKFTLKERDNETGLDYSINRYYSSTQGRFTSPDPLHESGEPPQPQSWNRYSYVVNNPLKFVDPDGLRYVQRKDANGNITYGWCATDECYDAALKGGWSAVSFNESQPHEYLTVGGGGGDRYTKYRLNPDGTHGYADVLDGNYHAMSTDWNAQLAIGGFLNGLRSFLSGLFTRSVTTGTATQATQQATTHGAQRLAERTFSEADKVLTKTGQQFLQKNGATVFLKEVAPGKFNVLVEGQRGVITALKNVSEKKIAKLAANYGWYSPLK